MSPRNWKFRLEDIIEALDRILQYVEDLDYDCWLKDQKTIDAVVRNLEIIGEAVHGSRVGFPFHCPFLLVSWFEDNLWISRFPRKECPHMTRF